LLQLTLSSAARPYTYYIHLIIHVRIFSIDVLFSQVMSKQVERGRTEIQLRETL